MTLCLLVSCQEKQSHNGEISDTSTENGDSSVFDVQNGKLIGYSGEETVIALPESVSEITSDSFKNRKESIESIRIGENVMRIADDIFVGMENLSSVEVADSNPYYTSSGSFLVSKTGSTMFMFAREKFDTSIFDYADTVGAQNFCKDGFKIVFGDAVLYFDGSSPRYSIENTMTLSEKYTAEQLKDEFDALNSFYEQFDSPDKSETLDELFDQNKSKYGMFEWNDEDKSEAATTA